MGGGHKRQGDARVAAGGLHDLLVRPQQTILSHAWQPGPVSHQARPGQRGDGKHGHLHLFCVNRWVCDDRWLPAAGASLSTIP
jgi:hypothetical protein